jgi:hypothetical protein
VAAFDLGDPLLKAARVVVLDACSTLDVIRIPVRPEWSADADSVEAVIDIASDPATLILAMTEAIEVEFHSNRQKVTTEVRHELRRYCESLDSNDPSPMADMLKRCGLSLRPPGELSLEWFEAVAVRFEVLTDRAYAVMGVRPNDPDDVMPAWERVAVRRAPAVRGSKSMVDAVLCETALRVSRQRPRGTTGLLTSNKKDFRKAGALHPDLVDSYDDSGLVDLPTWRDALMFARGSTGS